MSRTALGGFPILRPLSRFLGRAVSKPSTSRPPSPCRSGRAGTTGAWYGGSDPTALGVAPRNRVAPDRHGARVAVNVSFNGCCEHRAAVTVDAVGMGAPPATRREPRPRATAGTVRGDQSRNSALSRLKVTRSRRPTAPGHNYADKRAADRALERRPPATDFGGRSLGAWLDDDEIHDAALRRVRRATPSLHRRPRAVHPSSARLGIDPGRSCSPVVAISAGISFTASRSFRTTPTLRSACLIRNRSRWLRSFRARSRRRRHRDRAPARGSTGSRRASVRRGARRLSSKPSQLQRTEAFLVGGPRRRPTPLATGAGIWRPLRDVPRTRRLDRGADPGAARHRRGSVAVEAIRSCRDWGQWGAPGGLRPAAGRRPR